MEAQSLKLQALLAEFTALRAEIQQRTDFQNRAFQLHITTLSLIIGFIITQSKGYLLIYLIPIESFMFGLYFYNQANSVQRIGKYIKNKIEQDVNSLLHTPDIMAWEQRTYQLTNQKVKNQHRKNTNYLSATMFDAPGIISGIVSVILFILNTNPFYNLWFQPRIPGHIVFTEVQWIISMMSIGISLFLFNAYRSARVMRLKSDTDIMLQTAKIVSNH